MSEHELRFFSGPCSVCCVSLSISTLHDSSPSVLQVIGREEHVLSVLRVVLLGAGVGSRYRSPGAVQP